MAFLKRRSCLASLILLALLMAEQGIAFKLDADAMFGHHPPMVDCGPAPAQTSKNDGAYRANVLSAIGALPSAAAAAPTGFATAARSGGAGPDRAFARGLCFGLGARHGSSPSDCLACLSAAARDVVTDECGASRRAAVWRTGCFLSFADTNASSAREAAFRGWLYDDFGVGPAAALGSQCAGDITAADCSRCTTELARVGSALKRGGHLALIHGDAVVVVGYHCYLRVHIDHDDTEFCLLFALFIMCVTIVCLTLFDHVYRTWWV